MFITDKYMLRVVPTTDRYVRWPVSERTHESVHRRKK